MATTYSYLPGLATGSGLSHPVIMRAGGMNLDDYTFQLEIKDSAEIAIGDVIMIAGGLVDATGASETGMLAVVLDSNRNKSILESHGLTVSKAVQFTDGDKIDVLLLVPGVILSLKCEGGVDMQPGDPIGVVAAGKVEFKASITLNEAAPNTLVTTSDPLGKIGRILGTVATQDGTDGYIPVLIGA
jgi:hypothetical protein